MRRPTRALLSIVIAFVLAGPVLAAPRPYVPPPDTRGGWRTLKEPQEVRARAGIDAVKLDEALAYAKTTSQHGGLLVVRHGHLVYESYFGRGHREATPELASVGKAFTSIAVGMAIHEKRRLIPQGLDTKVITPRYMPAEVFPLDDPRKAEITLGQLLAMSAGFRGQSPGYENGQKVEIPPLPNKPAADGGARPGMDLRAVRTPLWCAPGDCSSYASNSPHVASMVVRRLVGMEMQAYIEQKLARPLGWGRWGYALHRKNETLEHTPGAGSIAMRSTDVLRFGYLLLHEGRWGARQIVPAPFVRAAGQASPYNAHQPYGLGFNVNTDGHIAGVPRDAYYKSGSIGFTLYVVPSLDLVVYRMGGTDGQYDPALTKLPVLHTYDGSRAGWTGKNQGNAAAERLLQLVVAAVVDGQTAAVTRP